MKFLSCLITAFLLAATACTTDHVLRPDNALTSEVEEGSDELLGTPGTDPCEGIAAIIRTPCTFLSVAFANPLTATEIDSFAASVPTIGGYGDPHHVSPIGPVVPDGGVSSWSFGLDPAYFGEADRPWCNQWDPTGGEVDEAMRAIMEIHPYLVTGVTVIRGVLD